MVKVFILSVWLVDSSLEWVFLFFRCKGLLEEHKSVATVSEKLYQMSIPVLEGIGYELVGIEYLQ